MNIGIDADHLFEKGSSGRYARFLIQNLLKIDKKNHYFLYITYSFKNREKKDFFRQFIADAPGNRVFLVTLPFSAWLKKLICRTRLAFSNIIKEPINLYISFDLWGIPRHGFARTILVLDSRELENTAGRKRFEKLSKKLDRIVTSTAAEKNLLMEHSSLKANQIDIVFGGVGSELKIMKQNRLLLGQSLNHISPGSPYLLSAADENENFSTILRAFANLSNMTKRKFKLVLFTGSTEREQVLKTVNNYNLKEKVTFIEFASDEDMPYIYNGATIFIYAESAESFPLPALEAMATGVPIISVKTDAAREILTDSALFVEQNDEAELTVAINRIINGGTFAKKLLSRGLKRAKKFTWEKSAEKLLRTITQVKKTTPKRGNARKL